MIRFILVSHGPTASAAKETLCMFCGSNLEDIETLCLSSEMTPDEFLNRLQILIPANTDKTVIICDLPGGTPCNESLKLAAANPQITVLSSLSIPLLLELYLNKETDDFEKWIHHGFEAARRSYLNMSKTLDGNDVSNEEF